MTATAPGVGTVRSEIRASVGWVTLSNPRRHNALSTAMMGQLDAELRALDEAGAIRVIVLRGEGDRAFAAGADISEFEAQQGFEQVRREGDETVARLFDGLSALRTPLVAMIAGYCFGAGVAVALAADIRIAAQSSTFAIPAARLGIGYPVPLTHALAHTVGPARAAEILFTGRRFAADEAERIGLVNRVVPAHGLESEVDALAATIAQNAPLSIRAAKRAIACAFGPDDAVADELVRACTDSADVREGQRAFMEKRAPRFTGR